MKKPITSILSHSHTLFVLCALAFVLRLIPALQNRFHADEALYSSWAMHVASGRDALLASVPVDKPPLAIYTMAASLAVFGRSELAARLPNLIASTLSIALVWHWARRLYPSSLIPHHLPSPRSGGGSSFASLAMALSPFNIAFGGTAFLDPLMVMWGLAACVLAARGRAGWSGVCLGLAFATKVQGLLFAPLVLITAQTAETATKVKALNPSARLATFAVRSVLGFSSIAVPVLAWSFTRGGIPFWVQQVINYGGIRAATVVELGPRLNGWLGLLPHFFGPLIGVLLLAGLPVLLINALRIGRGTTSASAIAQRVAAGSGMPLGAAVGATDALLLAYGLGFLALHWLLAFPVWDRYLLALVPVAAVLLGRSVGLWADRPASSVSRWFSRPKVQLAVVALLMLPFSLQAARSDIPIGGDHGPHDGIDLIETHLRRLPAGTVVYDHWIGWEFDFYLWGAALYRAYFDTPADLARDLRVFGRASARYIILPPGQATGKIERAISAEGFELLPDVATTDRFGRASFSVYQITPESR